jgi:DNA-binding transcriptional MerR regulator
MFEGLRRLQGDTFALDALVDTANRQVASAGLTADDKRVAGEIDARTVRYYQTQGLVSRPDRSQGRQARYGYRQLLQLMAIKALQAQGLSLDQIGAWLPDRPIDALQLALAGSLGGTQSHLILDPDRPVQPHSPPEEPHAEVAPTQPMLFPLDMEPGRLSAFRLAPGVDLLVDPSRVADPGALARRIGSLLGESAAAAAGTSRSK